MPEAAAASSDEVTPFLDAVSRLRRLTRPDVIELHLDQLRLAQSATGLPAGVEALDGVRRWVASAAAVAYMAAATGPDGWSAALLGDLADLSERLAMLAEQLGRPAPDLAAVKASLQRMTEAIPAIHLPLAIARETPPDLRKQAKIEQRMLEVEQGSRDIRATTEAKLLAERSQQATIKQEGPAVAG
jgi:hypothetical protein